MSVKPCLFNLVIYSDNKEQLPYLNGIANSMITKYPARVITVTSDKGIESPKITKPNDQVLIELPPKVLDSISLFVLPYLIPDYPICLFFSGNPGKDNPVFKALIRLSERLIVDSETSDNMPNFCTTILAEIEKHQLDVIDLNWARTLGWRLTLSSLFDSKEKLESLATARTIRFYYQRGAHSINPALYLQAWLASQLHWEFSGRDGMEVLYRHRTGVCCFVLEPTDETDSIEIQTTTLDYQCKQAKDSPQVCIHVSSQDACELPYKLFFPNFERGSSYLTQLLYSTNSKQYVEMLPMLRKFYE